jgi:hypothetical protein
LEPFIPEDPTFSLVTHQDERVFAILAPPKSAAEDFLCANKKNSQNKAEAVPSDHPYSAYPSCVI